MASMCQLGRNSMPGRSTPNVYSINDAKSVASTARNAARAETCIGAMLVASSVMSYLSKRLKLCSSLISLGLWQRFRYGASNYGPDAIKQFRRSDHPLRSLLHRVEA